LEGKDREPAGNDQDEDQGSGDGSPFMGRNVPPVGGDEHFGIELGAGELGKFHADVGEGRSSRVAGYISRLHDKRIVTPGIES
jgi:hypothetical protein